MMASSLSDKPHVKDRHSKPHMADHYGLSEIQYQKAHEQNPNDKPHVPYSKDKPHVPYSKDKPHFQDTIESKPNYRDSATLPPETFVDRNLSRYPQSKPVAGEDNVQFFVMTRVNPNSA
ncbi:hypothetical protein BJV82DRAFT_371803 [Fennellomyces sp. T-0311]|nr:hypothetical protein BJV82DRAFT_371803 [Fennellomyces sp. T-0311]